MAKYFFISLAVIISLLSCGASDQNTSPNVSSVATPIQDTLPISDTTNNWKIGKYFCPMQCEGEKMYDNPGKCPHCDMDLRVWRATATN